MKRTIIILLVLMLMLFLVSCSQDEKESGDASDNGPVDATQDAEYARLNRDKLDFDDALHHFYGGNVDKTLNAIEPLLTSAVIAQLDTETDFFHSVTKPLDPFYSWSLIYLLLNFYHAGDEGITEDQGGTLLVPVDEMKGFFKTAFFEFDGDIPDIPATDIANVVSFDESAGVYRILRADGPRYNFILVGIQLSKAESAAVSTPSSTVTLIMLTHDEILIGVTDVEIKQNPASKYGYSVQTVLYTPPTQ